MKNQLVSAIELQEVELQQKPADSAQGGSSPGNGERASVMSFLLQPPGGR